MVTGPLQSRFVIALCAALVVMVALVVAFGVIPQVQVADVASISPEDAVPAFWASVGVHVVAALALALTAALTKARSRISTTVLVVSGIAILLVGLLLGDAALAFREAAMQSVATLLFLCVAADVLAGAVTIASAVRRPAGSPTRAPHATA